jgi:type III secretion protein V
MTGRLARNSDIILALFVVAITTMLLVPLPTLLLDFLLVINISISLLVLLAGLYTRNPLALFSFPSLLLLTTLFRLGLNVASSRLILKQHDAGNVIHAFGTVLIGDQIVVGVILFTIITIVLFIVIARGSSRVSEVAARFALDALPGKQMSIDADLRAGALSSEEAERRRDQLRRESQFYGSMDGAMKFVQGDAIAGFFIILTNIIGGMYLGISEGMDFSEAIRTYTVLTVGDGLVSQIPAILISICAGIVVTRVSSGNDTSLGSDVGSQLFAQPVTLFFASFLLFFVGLLPGLPWLPFSMVAAVILIAGLYIKRSQGRQALAASGIAPSDSLGFRPRQLLPDGSRVDPSLLPESPLVLMLEPGVLYELYRAKAEQYRNEWVEFSSAFFEETGLNLPSLSVVPAEFSSAPRYAVMFNGTSIDTGKVLLDSLVVETNPDSAAALGIDVGLEVDHPLTSARVFWAHQSPILSKIVDAADIRTFDFIQYIRLRIGAFFARNPEEIFSLTDVHNQLKQLERQHPGLIADAFQNNFISLSRLTEILQELAREGFSIRDFRQIVEAVAGYCSSHGIALNKEEDLDFHDLVGYLRHARRRSFTAKLLSSRQTLKVFTLSEQLEQTLEDVPDPQGSSGAYLAIDPSRFSEIRASLQTALEPIRQRGALPVSVLCRTDLRARVTNLIRSCNKALKVVTFEELDPLVVIEPVGVWG